MKKRILLFYIVILGLVISSCQCSSSIKKEGTVAAASREQGQDFMNRIERKVSKLSFDEQIAFVQMPGDEIDLVDMSAYAQEREIELKSNDEIKLIKDEFMKEAMEKADPETGSLDGVFLSVRAVSTIRAMPDIAKAVSQYKEIGGKVSTFEIRVSEEFDGNTRDECAMGCVVGLVASSSRRNRVVVSGEGQRPVKVGKLRFSLGAGIVQIRNLMWTDVSSIHPLVSVSADSLFSAQKLIVVNNGNANPSGLTKGGMPGNPIMGGVPVQPGPISFISLSSGAMEPNKAAYHLDRIYAENNHFEAFVKLEDASSERFDRAVLSHLRMVDNSISSGIDISVKTSVLIKDYLSSEADRNFTFVGEKPQIEVEDSNVEL